jgi:cation transporter-like permease
LGTHRLNTRNVLEKQLCQFAHRFLSASIFHNGDSQNDDPPFHNFRSNLKPVLVASFTILRILLGGLFAIVGVLGFYANVFFGFIEPGSGTFGIAVCLIAAISGASERLVPSLITSFSDKASADFQEDPDDA